MNIALLLQALTLSVNACNTANATTSGAIEPILTTAQGPLRPVFNDTPLACGARQNKKTIIETAINITAGLLAVAPSCAQIVSAALAVVHRGASRGSEYLRAFHGLSELTFTRHGNLGNTGHNYIRWDGVVTMAHLDLCRGRNHLGGLALL